MLGNDLLEGELVQLTAITREDLPLFTEWFANIEFRRFLALIAMPFTLEDEQDWFEFQRKDPDTINFAIRTLDDDQLIGSCGIMAIHWPARNCIVGIGVSNASYWGQGYGTDAMRVLLKYAFMELDLHRVGLDVYSYNTRAIKSYEKIGFQLETVARENILRDGQYFDMHHMSILRREWEARYLTGEGK